jgi:glutamate-ammonia-ligase adenylyltransferase
VRALEEEFFFGEKTLPALAFNKLQETLKSYPASARSEILKGALGQFSHVRDPELLEKILVRVDAYFGSAARRIGLKRLFGTCEPWLAPFCRAIASSELVAALLSHNPALVEGHAMGSGIFIPAVQWEQSGAGLVETAEEYGEKLEWIRRLKNERTIQLALADLGGLLDFTALEEEQTFLADFIIRNTLKAVRQNLGLPAGLPLSVLAMGKLGSGEMSYLSDLDLVFVYAPEAHEPDDQIPGKVVRLIQRFMNMLYTPLQEGPGYPMDVRLRPTGTHGPLVVTPKSWLEYYESRTDIWEIQALLRIRHIAGEPELGQWIEDKASEICFRQRPPESVWPRICHLRNRMEKERAAETEWEIDLKLGMGGLADIEFMVQGQLLVGGSTSESGCQTSQGPHPAPGVNAVSGPCPTGAESPLSHSGCSDVPPLPEGVEGRGRGEGLHWSVRRLVREFLKDTSKSGPGGIGSSEISEAFAALRALDHRVRLHTNSSAAKLDERRLEAMVLLGLWPPRFDGSSIETWEDILRLRREVRRAFKMFCPQCP